MKKLIQANLDLLNWCTDILDGLNQEQFNKCSSVILDETIGKHFRHIIEFYLSLCNSTEMKVINYDDRERNELLETDIHFAKAKLKQIKISLSEFKKDENLTVKVNLSLEDSHWQKTGSSIKRELSYLHDHTVHHLFMIRIVLEHERINLPNMKNLGMNSSTLRSRACAS